MRLLESSRAKKPPVTTSLMVGKLAAALWHKEPLISPPAPTSQTALHRTLPPINANEHGCPPPLLLMPPPLPSRLKALVSCRRQPLQDEATKRSSRNLSNLGQLDTKYGPLDTNHWPLSPSSVCICGPSRISSLYIIQFRKYYYSPL